MDSLHTSNGYSSQSPSYTDPTKPTEFDPFSLDSPNSNQSESRLISEFADDIFYLDDFMSVDGSVTNVDTFTAGTTAATTNAISNPVKHQQVTQSVEDRYAEFLLKIQNLQNEQKMLARQIELQKNAPNNASQIAALGQQLEEKTHQIGELLKERHDLDSLRSGNLTHRLKVLEQNQEGFMLMVKQYGVNANALSKQLAQLKQHQNH